MENGTVPARKKWIEWAVICFVLLYGLHYFAYFIRARYYNLISPLTETAPGVYQILMYLGHLFFLVCMILFVIAVKDDRKYLRAMLPKSGNNSGKMILIGALAGMGANLLCALVAVLHGDIVIHYTGVDSIPLFILGLLAVAIQASVEEIESRSLLHGKMIDGGVPVPAAILISSLFFSYLHAANPGYTFVPFISILLVGLLYALIYTLTGSLWLSCACHTMWNFTQDFILGLPDSGKPSRLSIFNTEVIHGSAFYDETFGIEGGITAILLHLTLVIVFAIILAKRTKKAAQE